MHYEILSDRPIPHELRREIGFAQAMLNHHFSWTEGVLSLRVFDEPWTPKRGHQAVRRSSSRGPRIASGSTATGTDEWNSCLVGVFLRWVSTRLPEAVVALYDEGNYVLPGCILIRNGQPGLNRRRLARQPRFLVEGNLGALEHLEEVVRQAESGTFLASIPVQDYADSPEIASLRLPADELAQLTLADIVCRLPMPWEQESLITEARTW
jgi:hypothetical protein